jgi:hypothetical protein
MCWSEAQMARTTSKPEFCLLETEWRRRTAFLQTNSENRSLGHFITDCEQLAWTERKYIQCPRQQSPFGQRNNQERSFTFNVMTDKLFLKGTINKQPGLSRPGIIKFQILIMANISAIFETSTIIRSVKSFFDLRTSPSYKKSRIVRRSTKVFEEFIFKGYDQQAPGLSRPGYFKSLKMLCKN